MTGPYGATTTADELTKDLAQEIKGKVVLITGASPGSIGATFVQSIASAHPELVILAGRSPAKLQKTAESIKAASDSAVAVRTLELDLSSLAAVRQAAEVFNGWEDVPRVDVLVSNAGVMAGDFTLSPDGHEIAWATNHLGPFLFTNLVIDKLLASASPRVVTVSSDGHRLSAIRWADYDFHNGETYNEWLAYGQSKTANMLMAKSLAEKLGPKKGLLAFSLHPGTVPSNLTNPLTDSDMDGIRAADRFMGNAEAWKEYIFKTEQQGAATHVYAAFSPDLADHNGSYLEDCHVADPWTQTVKPWATSSVEAERLWKLSEELVGQKFDL